jgi:hypothetical protein
MFSGHNIPAHPETSKRKRFPVEQAVLAQQKGPPVKGG